jgi:serine/threonine-protein kinase
MPTVVVNQRRTTSQILKSAAADFDAQNEPPAIDPNKHEFDYPNRLKVLRPIAEGGMGSVFLGEQLGEAGFSKTVAIKIIKPDRLADPRILQMFTDEAKLVADLVHMNIAQVYNLGRTKNQHFIVMEYLHAKTLSEYLRFHRERHKIPDPDMCAFLISRVCRGLDYAHHKRGRDGQPLGIVHRDVTPSNVMMDFRGAVKLTDFGIAKALTVDMPDETKVIMGKFPYMSPEQAAGSITDARSDLFSLGLVLYELLTLTQVYTPATRTELLELMSKYRIRDPRKIVPGLPEALVKIVMKALETDVNARYQTAQDFGDALETFMYSKGYGPTNEKLAKHLRELWPEVDVDKIE